MAIAYRILSPPCTTIVPRSTGRASIEGSVLGRPSGTATAIINLRTGFAGQAFADLLDPGKGFGTYGPMRKLTYGAILAAIWLPLPAMAVPRFIPDCAGPVEIAHVHVVRVEKNGALILDDGRAVMLEGIRLDGGPDGLSDRALAALRAMALAEPVTFTAVAPKEDRYDRIRAQAFGERWFQTALLEQG